MGNAKKRKTIFQWLDRTNSNIIFLQETHTTNNDEATWNEHFGDHCIFSHGTSASRGIAIIFRNCDYTINQISTDSSGRIIIISVDINCKPYLLINSYAPNHEADHVLFLESIFTFVNDMNASADREVIWGGDHNLALKTSIDRMGGNPSPWKISLSKIEELCAKYDLVDIWRLRNPHVKRYTWRRLRPNLVQSRIDFFLTSDSLQMTITKADITPSVLTDHSAISITIGDSKHKLGSSYWKLNNSLLFNPEYIDLIQSNFPIWLGEYGAVNDVRLAWEFIKHKIKIATIRFSKTKARERKNKIKTLEQKLTHLENFLTNDPSEDIKTQIELVQIKLNVDNKYVTECSIIRSRASWYEIEEKIQKKFLGLNAKMLKNHIIAN